VKRSDWQVGVVGCGVVGAAIAYELAQVPGIKVTVLDRRSPDQWEATAAALGVLMAATSSKLKGKALQMRLASLQRYETLVPELERLIGCEIPFNRQGILSLCFDPSELSRWQQVAKVRSAQGFPLEILDPAEVRVRYPELQDARALKTDQPLIGAVYSPCDRQIDPVVLTQALIKAAQEQGVTFHFQTTVQGFTCVSQENNQRVQSLQTSSGELSLDWLVLASGLGSSLLTQELQQPVDIRPVLGQAMHLQLQQPLAPDPRAVITGLDVHLVPAGLKELWVGATVEFSSDSQLDQLQPDPSQLAAVHQQAIALCPALADARVTRTWSGLRPRPQGRPAPVVEPLPGYSNVLLATGHYRNGVLLAPITALTIREMISQLSAANVLLSSRGTALPIALD